MKSARERQVLYITYIWKLKYDTNELIYKQKQTHRHRNLKPVTKGEQGRTNKEFRISKYKLLYKKIDKTRSYSTAKGTIFNIL